jgi:hypothetical protein
MSASVSAESIHFSFHGLRPESAPRDWSRADSPSGTVFRSGNAVEFTSQWLARTRIAGSPPGTWAYLLSSVVPTLAVSVSA